MARNQYLVCEKTGEYVWIGQSPNGIEPDGVNHGVIYGGCENTMNDLQAFLYAHHGENLRFLDEHDIVDMNLVEYKR